MENVIKKKQKIATDTFMLTVRAPGIAKKAKPGHSSFSDYLTMVSAYRLP